MPSSVPTRRPPDWISIGLVAVGFAALIFGAEALASRAWLALTLVAVAALFLSVLWRRETPKSLPLVPFDLLRVRAFRLSVIASICCFVGQTAGLLALPFYLHGLGETPFTVGLYMTSWPVAVAAAAIVSGRLASRFAPALLCTAGGVLLATGMAGAALLPLHQASLALVACTVLCGLGFGVFQVPNNRAMLLEVPVTRSAAAGGMQGTARLLGQTFGSVLVTVLFVSAPALAAPRLSLAIGAMFALAAAIVSATRRVQVAAL
jgi:DHA2 family multidrug resistance protein-like MFS transporter